MGYLPRDTRKPHWTPVNICGWNLHIYWILWYIYIYINTVSFKFLCYYTLFSYKYFMNSLYNGKIWTELIWLRTGTSCRLLWKRELTCRYHKMRGTYRLAEDLLESWARHSFVELASKWGAADIRHTSIYMWPAFNKFHTGNNFKFPVDVWLHFSLVIIFRHLY